MDGKLREKSVQVILENQSSYGSFPASPSFPQFRYCFLRDAVFTAHGILVSGYSAEAKKFYEWVNTTLIRHRKIVETLKQKVTDHQPLSADDFLPTRYNPDGSLEAPMKSTEIPFHFRKWPEVYSLSDAGESDAWPNFQTDGYGAWLWGVSEFVRITGDLEFLEHCRKSIEITLDYLELTWEMPCFDPWEEYGTKRAVSTLGSIAGGLIGINRFYQSPSIGRWIDQIRETLRSAAAPEGFLPKHIGGDEIDGSALWLMTPYQVLSPEEEITRRTVSEIEDRLVNGGVKRYLSDVYYGGGEWFVMTLWLAWHYCENGQAEKGAELIKWCDTRADENYCFPEQSLEHLNFPEYLALWKENWRNTPPSPMLWAHGMYLIACSAFESAKR